MNRFIKIFRKYKKILISINKIGIFLLLIFGITEINKIPNTNSFFTDKEIANMEFSTGVWIPTLEMRVSPSEPDGKDGWYEKPPCVKLFSDIDNVTIHYSFTSENNPIEGTTEEDVCIYPPEGESVFEAYAVNKDNDKWVSDEIREDFKVEFKTKEGDVVINELMWMGSLEDSDDEWIELRNITNRKIDLSNWNIKYAGSGKNGHIEIPHGYSIEAKGYFLITAQKWNETEINLKADLDKDEGYTNVSGMSLKDDGEKLVLEDKNKNTIDTAWKDEHWNDGWHGLLLHMSMERDIDPGDGTLASSWHTCINRKCNDKEYWRNQGFNFGTPGKENSTRDKIIIPGCDDFEKIILDLLDIEQSNKNSGLENETLIKNTPANVSEEETGQPSTEEVPNPQLEGGKTQENPLDNIEENIIPET